MNLLNFGFILSFFYFLIAIFISLYIPGVYFVRRIRQLTQFQITVLSVLFGLSLWGFQGFIFGYLQLRFLTYIYLIVFAALWIKSFKIPSKIVIPKFRITDPIIAIIIFLGIIAQIVSVWFNGIKIKEGFLFCCGSVQDSVLHLAITDEIVKRFPPYEPGMYGTLLTNYHYWGSLVIAELVRIFGLPLIPTSYQFMTIFVSLFLGLAALVFAQLLKIGKAYNRWLLFFLYFGGDFIWMLVAIFRGDSFFVMRPLESGSQFLENFPRAFAVIVFFAAFSLFVIWIKRKDLYTGIIMSIMLASLVAFKINIGVFAFSGLGILGIYYLIKKDFKMLPPLIFSVIVALILYIPVNSGSGGLYFTGLWRFENFIVQPWLDLERLELARIIYQQHNNILRVIQYELMYIGIFVFAVFGTKLLGFIQDKKSLALFPKEIHIVFIPAMIVSFIAGSFFSQDSGGSNSFNFLVSIFIFGSIYTALACFYWLKGVNVYLKYLLTFLIIVLTITRVVNQSYSYAVDFKLHHGYLITNNELKAIDFLASKPTGLVMTDPVLKIDGNSPYLTFLTGQKMFLSGIIDELEAHNINYKDRLNARNKVFYSKSPKTVARILNDNKVNYLYLTSSSRLAATDSANYLNPIFYNNNIKILQFDPVKAKAYLQ